MAKKVYVGMSGGVDSSVAVALLKQQGYDVTGVYMKNWSQDLPGFVCPWREDYQDAKRVAVQLGIDFKLYDFEKEYRHKVVDYMVHEYQAGRTPNPDIMCNQEVKFKLFLETALEDGADMIATGHYARIQKTDPYVSVIPAKAGIQTNRGIFSGSPDNPRSESRTGLRMTNGQTRLLVGVDKSKDQSYFLYRVSEAALQKSLMPIGEYKKSDIRKIATKLQLATAEKKDSQGICFVGNVGIKEFLLAELGQQPHGSIIDQAGKQIGEHDGAIFYTIGQRHGLDVGGGLPYYVTSKDMEANTIYVTTDLDDKNLWRKEIELIDIHWINQISKRTLITKNSPLKTRLRYRGPLVSCQLKGKKLILADEQRGIATGQSAVIYDADRVLGGGIIC